jgi:hypothetical protein
MKTVYFFVHGIMNLPSSGTGWVDGAIRAVAGFGFAGDAYRYLATPALRWVMQAWRVRQCRIKLQKWIDDDFQPVLVGHSNGCDILLKAIKGVRGLRGAKLHLISGAAEADFKVNGLNEAMKAGRIDTVTVWVAGKDSALEVWAPISRALVGWLGLGYKNIGATGPSNVSALVGTRVFQINEPEFGHSTWFEEKHFEETICRIAA